MSELMIHVRHMRQAKLCMAGTRTWFAAPPRQWPWADFVANGRPAQDFIDTGDPLAMRPVEAARREAEQEKPRIYPRHVGQANLCMEGAREWFAARHWHWQTFLDNGWDMAEVEATGCPTALRIVEAARREAANGV